MLQDVSELMITFSAVTMALGPWGGIPATVFKGQPSGAQLTVECF